MKQIKVNLVLRILVLLLIFLALSSCASTEVVENCVVDKEYGFFSGLWHGLISLFSLIGSIFSSSIAIYAVNNTGFFYDLGFLLGIISMTTLTLVFLVLGAPLNQL